MSEPKECGSPSKVRSLLNNAKVLSPLLGAVFATHGSADDTAFANAQNQIGKALEQTVSEVIGAVAPYGAKASLHASTAAALSPLIAATWKREPGQDAYPSVAAGFLRLVQFVKPNPDMMFTDSMPRATPDALAEARAVSRILPTVFRLEKLPPATRKLYLSDNSVETFQERCRSDITGMAREAAERLEPDGKIDGGRSQSIAYRSALNCLSEVYAEALADGYATLTRKLNVLRAGTDGERKDFLNYAASCSEGPLPEHYRSRVRHLAEDLLYPAVQENSSEDAPGF